MATLEARSMAPLSGERTERIHGLLEVVRQLGHGGGERHGIDMLLSTAGACRSREPAVATGGEHVGNGSGRDGLARFESLVWRE